MSERLRTHVVVAGGGPAGLALPVGAAYRGQLEALSDLGLVIVDKGKGSDIGVGGIGRLVNPSNSGGEDFPQHVGFGPYTRAVRSAVGQSLVRRGATPVDNLQRDVAPFLRKIGTVTRGILSTSRSGVRTGETVQEAQQTPDGTWSVITSKGTIETDVFVVATGAEEKLSDELQRQKNNGKTVFTSGEVLSTEALADIEKTIDRGEIIAVRGSRHSAFSVARLVVDTFGQKLQPGQLLIMHRGPIKVYYDSLESAQTAEYLVEPGDINVDSVTGRVTVNRYPGIRHSSARLYEDVISGREERIRLHETPTEADAIEVFNAAGAIVQATGYRARGVVLKDVAGASIDPLVGSDGHFIVNDSMQLLDADGNPIPNVYAIGHGYSPIENGTRLDGINNYHERGVIIFDSIMGRR